MDLYRSRDMKYVAITITNESTYTTLTALGKFEKFHIVDLNAHNTTEQPHKNIALYKKKIVDIVTQEKVVQSLYQQCALYNVDTNVNASVNTVNTANTDVLEYITAQLQPLQTELTLSVQFQQDNAQSINNLIEKQCVLNVLNSVDLRVMQPATLAQRASSVTSQQSLLGDDSPVLIEHDDLEQAAGDERQFRNLISGTIAVAQQQQLQRAIYRASRGNALARFVPIDQPFVDPVTHESVEKSVFYVIVLGQLLYEKLLKIADTLHANIIPVTTDRRQYSRLLQVIGAQISEQQSIHTTTQQQIVHMLQRVANDKGSCTLRDYEYALVNEKLICEVYMKAHYYLTMMSIEGWCPTEELKALSTALKQAVAGTGQPCAAIEVDPVHPILAPASPPTYFITNKFTETYQGIVDTYGVPRYKEVNPGLFTIITFPFLFGVMYGDVGHGSLLTLFAILLIKYEKQLQRMINMGTLGEIPSMAFSGRYVLISMGIFAVYCGIIYNDCFSIPLWFYQSAFTVDPVTGEYTFTGPVYPLGLDPAWAHTANELAFYNSFKMKMSVTLGVTQMLFGILLSLSNHLYFNDHISIYFEFIPRLVFMCCTFGYMIFMILLKWMIDWTQAANPPPNLIQTMIAMFLSPGTIDPTKQLYAGQGGFQSLLLFCALISVPVMLLGKPYAHKYKRQRQHGASVESIKAATQQQLDADFQLVRQESGMSGDMASPQPSPDVDANLFEQGTVVSDLPVPHKAVEHEEHSFSDEMIHQAIHTIEFVLGCVSNTASYLRLWALSLAHAELSSVFWDKMIMQYGIEGGSAIGAFIGFAIWFAATFGVLLAMDVLECFLHALRLHWVEFQSKFYYADGYSFEPIKIAKYHC